MFLVFVSVAASFLLIHTRTHQNLLLEDKLDKYTHTAYEFMMLFNSLVMKGSSIICSGLMHQRHT